MKKHRQSNNNRRHSSKSNAPSAAAKRTVILLNKPFGVLSQFTDRSSTTPSAPDNKEQEQTQSKNAASRSTLADYVPVKGVYPAGRLDRDSEGLLLLTNDGVLQSRIAEPRFKLPKSYFAQVEGTISDQALGKLLSGVKLNDGHAQALTARQTDEPDWLWPREPPVRYRKTVPDGWINIVLTEGRNRQVRRMTAAVGLPTLRLIRYSIGEWTIDSLQSGEWRVI